MLGAVFLEFGQKPELTALLLLLTAWVDIWQKAERGGGMVLGGNPLSLAVGWTNFLDNKMLKNSYYYYLNIFPKCLL